MNNLLSYCGLIDAKLRASDKDLPVLSPIIEKQMLNCVLLIHMFVFLHSVIEPLKVLPQ